MQQSSESDRFVVCSEHIVLECSKCGERKRGFAAAGMEDPARYANE